MRTQQARQIRQEGQDTHVHTQAHTHKLLAHNLIYMYVQANTNSCPGPSANNEQAVGATGAKLEDTAVTKSVCIVLHRGVCVCVCEY